MKTNPDYVKKEISAGRYIVGALIKGPATNRKWIPIAELSSHISMLCKRVDVIMQQQNSVDFLTCISSDLQQVAVLYVLPQQADAVSNTSTNSPISGNLLDALRGLVDDQLRDAADRVQSVINEFRGGLHPGIDNIEAALDKSINPNMAVQIMRQSRMDPAVIEAGTKIALGGQKDYVPETAVASGQITVEFIPTRGIDEKDSTVRVEVIQWSSAPDCLPISNEASFSLETCNDMQAVKALEIAQLHHKVVRCEVKVGRKISSSRFSLTIIKILNLKELSLPSESVQQLLFGV